ncbi:MAG: amidohydrolase family protein [Alphaproteobacteria bacterium]
MPGLADSHLHLVATATSLSGLDLSSDHPGSIDELVERLATLAARGSPEKWLRISGFEESRLLEGRFPTIAEPARAAGRHPLRLRHANRHT